MVSSLRGEIAQTFHPTPERSGDARPPNMYKTNPNTLKALGFRLLAMCTVESHRQCYRHECCQGSETTHDYDETMWSMVLHSNGGNEQCTVGSHCKGHHEAKGYKVKFDVIGLHDDAPLNRLRSTRHHQHSSKPISVLQEHQWLGYC